MDLIGFDMGMRSSFSGSGEVAGVVRQRSQQTPVKEPYLKPGERVVITEGSFSQVEAIFVSDDGDERVMLLLNILSGKHELSFPLTSVRKIAN